jgi:hypothetical protein
MTAADVPRFLIRAGSAGDWMIWDRVTRGAASLDNRKLIRLSREAAEAALARLLSPEEPLATQRPHRAGQWQVLYGHEVVDCRDESEAKTIARTLLKKRLRVSARLIDGQATLWTIEGRDQMRLWLSR